MACKAFLARACAFAAAATSASISFAAEPTPAPPPPPPFTWTGPYVGGQIGYAWANDNLYYVAYDPVSALGFNPSTYIAPNGVIGGAHIGFNYQIDKPGGGFVIGVEGSVDGASLNKTAVANFVGFGDTIISASTNTDIQGSIRGRFGIAWDRFMIYATGGVAFGGFNTSYVATGNLSGSPAINGGAPFYASNSFSNTRVGWTGGGGIADAITPNWIVFAEYRYTDFGTVGNTYLATTALSTVSGLSGGVLYSNRTLTQSQVQVGFSYKFDMSAPNPEWFSIF